MNPLIIVGLAGAGLLLLASSSKSTHGPTGLPSSSRLSYQILPKGAPTSEFVQVGPAIVKLDGTAIRNDSNLAMHRLLLAEFQGAIRARKRQLPRDADQTNTDAYSKELYWAPAWLVMYNVNQLDDSAIKQSVNGVPFDEYGRTMPGHFGGDSQDLWNQTFGGLLKNPLFKSVVVAALIASGPEGIAVYGAYTMWQNRGESLTIQNLALKAGREYVVAQCGPGCGVAFDFGVGVVSGKSYDKAAEDALMQEMTPQQKTAFKQGKEAYRNVS